MKTNNSSSSTRGWRPLTGGIRIDKYSKASRARRRKVNSDSSDHDDKDGKKDKAMARELESSDNFQYISFSKPDGAIKLEPLEVITLLVISFQTYILFQDENDVMRYDNVTDIDTSEYYGDPSIRPPRQVPGYGSPPPPAPVPDQNCYVETPCTRYLNMMTDEHYYCQF